MRFLMLMMIWHAVSTCLNTRPIFGILTEPSTDMANKTSYIAASYVKYLEQAGARVVPLLYTSSLTDLDTMMAGLNGLLFPGGSASLDIGSDFFKTAAHLFKSAIALNDKGVYFPIWGTCLGFEFLNIMGAGEDESVLDDGFDSEDLPLALNFTKDAPGSSLLSKIDPNLYMAMATMAITMNEHQSGVPPASYSRNVKLSNFFSVLATNRDRAGKEFISLVEGKTYPVYGSQFHPEKNNFEWNSQEATPIPHSSQAVRASQYFASFLVDEARYNEQSLGALEADALIYNYNPVFTGKTGGYFTQEYYF